MIVKKAQQREVRIDLTGPDGNAYAVMGYAKNFAKQLGYSKEKIDVMLKDMMSSDYENLVSVFDKHFGTFVILER